MYFSRNVVSSGLKSPSKLEGSASGDAVLCGLVADINLDGKAELLLGTYGKELLVYRCKEEEKEHRWQLTSRHSVPHPVHGLLYHDVTGDGARELIILTPKGLHVFQVFMLTWTRVNQLLARGAHNKRVANVLLRSVFLYANMASLRIPCDTLS